MPQKTIKRTLTIAGSDSGGGAGIQADLKTFSNFGVYGLCAITAVTAQNTKGVFGIENVSTEILSAQLEAVLSDIGTDSVKIGMLPSTPLIHVVVKKLKHFNLKNIVLDPVMIAKSGDLLLQPEALFALRQELIPLAMLITPNLPEASALLGYPVDSLSQMQVAALDLLRLGAQAVLIKGGHLKGNECVDVLAIKGLPHVKEFSSPRIFTSNNHGTGCTLSAAIAALLARGYSLIESVTRAKAYLSNQLQQGAEYVLSFDGKGAGPVSF